MVHEDFTYGGAKFDYDAYNDTIFAFAPNQEYSSSLMFGDVILDMNKDKDFIGVEILDASKKFNVSTYELLSPIRLTATLNITDDEVKMSVEFTFIKRNKHIVRSVSAIGVNDMNLSPGTATLALV